MPSQAESAVANHHVAAVDRLATGFALRLFEPELEAEYRDFSYRSYRQTRRVAICLLLASFLAFFAFDLLLLYSVGANPITLPVMLVRLCALLIIVFAAYRVLKSPDVATGYRWIPIGLGCLSLGMLLVTLIYHQGLEQMQLPYGLEGMMLIQIVIFVPIGYSYRNSLYLGIATLLCTGLALQLTTSGESPIQYLTSLAYLTLATIAAATAGYCQEHSMRVLFLTKRDLRTMADTDGLTQLYNRRSFDLLLQRALQEALREQTRIALIMLDLDHFKAINDAHGHPAGDAVIRAIGEILVRQTRETDVVGRIGGDEFAVILTHTDPEAAASKAEALAATLCTEKVLFNGIPLYVSAAYGITHIGIGDTAEKALARADEAMYADKALHRRAQAG
mgnify:CR=1 FL=1